MGCHGQATTSTHQRRLLPSAPQVAPFRPEGLYGGLTYRGDGMIEQESPRTRLEQLLRQRHVTLEEFRKSYQQAAGTPLSERQAYHWVAGEVRGLPYPKAQATLEQLFNEPVARLFGPPYGIEASNVGAETLDQLIDDLFRLVTAARQQPLPALLDDLVDTQNRAFKFLEGRQRPKQTRDLYVLAGFASGLMAKVSHDMGAPHDAMLQTRAAYACAENAGHDGLRAWVRALQSGIAYWSGRLDEAVRYIQLGVGSAARSRGTIGVWLASSEARSLAALGQLADARAALARASGVREHVQLDELDSLGLTFSWPRQLYLAADALAWGGPSTAPETERLALEALDAYMDSPPEHRAFGMEAGARSALAVARVLRREIEGATEALAPVFELPPANRIRGIVASVEHVRGALHTINESGRDATELASAIEGFTSQHLAPER